MNIEQMQKIRQAQQIQRPLQPGKTIHSPGQGEQDFRSVLEKAVTNTGSNLKLSAHAEQRIQQRGIMVTPQEMNQLQSAVDKAAEKGSKESLILMKEKAFIVNIPNKTVITAVDDKHIKENVFTNIDSTVVVG